MRHLRALRRLNSERAFVFAGAVLALGIGVAMAGVGFAHGALQGRLAASVDTTSGGARTKIAEGEYAIHEQSNDGAIGPFGEQIYNFGETWTIWRNANRTYRVEGVRKYESSDHESHAIRFAADLSRDFVMVRAQEFTQLQWVKDSGPLTCEFLPAELHCSSGGSDPRREIQMRQAFRHPYGLLWPISPFSLSGITRQVERDARHSTDVDLVSIQQPSQANPVQATILGGQIYYLGEESFKAAGRDWQALKFSLKPPLRPEYLIWTSPRGLLLAVAIKHPHKNWQDEGMRLEHFQSFGEF